MNHQEQTQTKTQKQVSMTNFEKVKQFNESFNVEHLTNIDKNVFDTHPDMVKLRLSLITEEFHELEDAIAAKDMSEVRDALADILYVVYGMQHCLGIKGDKDFDIVHDSNMSKLCVSEEEARQTVEWYQREFTEGRTTYDSPYFAKLVHLVNDQERWVVKNHSTGKVLKSINYTPVSWV